MHMAPIHRYRIPQLTVVIPRPVQRAPRRPGRRGGRGKDATSRHNGRLVAVTTKGSPEKGHIGVVQVRPAKRLVGFMRGHQY